MRLKSLLRTMVALYLTAGATVPADGSTNEPRSSPQTRQSDDGRFRTFSGTVWHNGGKFVLRDELHQVWYRLDDERWAARFEGKEVRVTGTLDEAKNVIHVQNIEEDPVQSK
jgi:hypothetical protein